MIQGNCWGCNTPLGEYAVGFKRNGAFEWYHSRCAPAISRE